MPLEQMLNLNKMMINWRIGHGYDVHILAKGKELWLGGVKVEHELGTIAYSDGDVVIHALCDALLGAVALGDIGKHFPDTAPEFSGVDSKILLKRTLGLILEAGYEIGNIDCTLCLQRPKVQPLIEQMRQTLGALLEVEIGAISVKATTTERLGFVGREEGVEAHAVVLLYQRSTP